MPLPYPTLRQRVLEICFNSMSAHLHTRPFTALWVADCPAHYQQTMHQALLLLLPLLLLGTTLSQLQSFKKKLVLLLLSSLSLSLSLPPSLSLLVKYSFLKVLSLSLSPSSLSLLVKYSFRVLSLSLSLCATVGCNVLQLDSKSGSYNIEQSH